MTKEIANLLRFLDTRKVVFIAPEDMPAAETAHAQGWIALNDNAAMITDEGRAAIRAQGERNDG